MKSFARAILAAGAGALLFLPSSPARALPEDGFFMPLFILNRAQPDQQVLAYLQKLSARAHLIWMQNRQKPAEPVLVRFNGGTFNFYLTRHFNDLKVDPSGARLLDAAVRDVPPPANLSFLTTFVFYKGDEYSQPEESVDDWCPQELTDKNFRILIREDEFADGSLGTVRIEKSSGSAKVDAQALAAVRKANKINRVSGRQPVSYRTEEFAYFGTQITSQSQKLYGVGVALPNRIDCIWQSRDYACMAFHSRPYVVTSLPQSK